MGKRSNFERVEKDFYPTPIEAVKPLIPHIYKSFDFSEPCCGDGRLVKHIEALTKGRCIQSSDINEGFDAKTVKINRNSSLVITNPPWTRSELHPIIENLSDQKPTWLLFDADWMHTKQSIPYLNRLKKIISVGRVKWIENSKMTGKDNVCWYLFDRPDPENFWGTEFVGRQDVGR